MKFWVWPLAYCLCSALGAISYCIRQGELTLRDVYFSLLLGWLWPVLVPEWLTAKLPRNDRGEIILYRKGDRQ